MFCPSMLYHFSFILIIFAGTPPTIALSGTSFTTTAFGATVTLLPILIFPITLHPTASSTLSPIVAICVLSYLLPTTTPEFTLQLLPID